MSEMLNNIRMHDGVSGSENNVEAAAPGRCPTAQQGGPGSNRATASHQPTSRPSWTKELNKIVMKCYIKSKPKKRGFRKRMLKIWNDTGIFQVSEQKLAGPALAIKNNCWISEMEMEELRRYIDLDEQGSEIEQDTSDEINDERKDHNRRGGIEDVNDNVDDDIDGPRDGDALDNRDFDKIGVNMHGNR